MMRMMTSGGLGGMMGGLGGNLPADSGGASGLWGGQPPQGDQEKEKEKETVRLDFRYNQAPLIAEYGTLDWFSRTNRSSRYSRLYHSIED